ncbi:MAG TPA: tetratricopeptide repeat protein [Candidatus Krumholzibacteria bacterium]|jgi:protein O-GlcNAc transferase|nr:tetratricopeptide repeat protein [Candidatus Krumholzibacteria bacterium]
MNEVRTVESYDHRSEVLSSGTKYYVQSSLLPSQRLVVTSLFHEGSLLTRQNSSYDGTVNGEALRSLVRRLHDEYRVRLTSLLDLRERLKKDVDAKAHLRLGEALYRQRLYREAMAEVIRSIKLGLEDAGAYSILGNCLLALGDSEKAMRAFQKGLELAPGYADLHNDLGVAHLKLERCKEAAASFERALECNRYYQTALLNLAIALSQNVVLKQDYDLSKDLRQRLRRLLELNLQLKPQLEGDDFRAAMNALDTEHYELVHEKLTAIKRDLDTIASNDLSLELYLILKFRAEELSEEDIDALLERLKIALESNPGYADIQNDMGVLYAAKCKIFIDKAHESFRQALQMNPAFRKAEKNLKLSGNDRQGIHFLLKALLD